MVLEAGDFYPSGFIRGLIYREQLERAGFQATFVSRLLQPFLRIAAAPSRLVRLLLRLPMAPRLLGWLERRAIDRNEAAIARAAAGADVVYLSKVTSLPFVKRLRAAGARRIVMDFGDAIWLPRYPSQGVNELIASVDAVTTDNELTAQYIRKLNPRCTVVPDAPQVEWFERRRAAVARPEEGTLVLGWIGSRSTTYNLFVAWEALERIFARHPHVHLRLLGADPRVLPPFERVRYSLVETYTQEQMIDEALRMDIGLFPLQDVEACRVRGVLKATVYMSAGAAAVCSRVGQCNDLIQDGVNGMLAGSSAEWEEKLERLIADAGARRRITEAGLAHVRRDFTVERSFAALRPVLEGA
jgi:glycosyltransferase involved in cell wall biosynthesis